MIPVKAGGLFMSAEELREYADKIEMARASKAYGGVTQSADTARQELLERLSKPIPGTPTQSQSRIPGKTRSRRG